MNIIIGTSVNDSIAAHTTNHSISKKFWYSAYLLTKYKQALLTSISSNDISLVSNMPRYMLFSWICLRTLIRPLATRTTFTMSLPVMSLSNRSNVTALGLPARSDTRVTGDKGNVLSWSCVINQHMTINSAVAYCVMFSIRVIDYAVVCLISATKWIDMYFH